MIRRGLERLAWTTAFALAYAQSPLYTSNQNQYFLHGLARAGYGFLRDDWLANTADPTPIFSWMVGALAPWPWGFYLVYAALMGVYLFSLLSIGGKVVDLSSPSRRRLVLAGLILMHSAALRFALARLLVPEAEFLLEGGVAGQRLLGAVLQPSAFGVLLVLSVALFLDRREVAAAAALAAAAAVHPTYLLSTGILLATYTAILSLRQEEKRRGLVTGLVGGALLAAVAVPVYLTFRPSGPDLYAITSDILVRLRIPHHAIPAKWIDWTVAVQALIVAASAWVGRRTRLAPILLVGSLAVVALTAVQIASDSDPLALLFPWRLSVVLVPIGSSTLVCAVVAWTASRWEGRAGRMRFLMTASLAAVVLVAVAGVYRFSTEREHQLQDPAAPMMAFVAAHLAQGDVYFIDPKLQDFRLRTGAPVVVDAKAIPYIDQEVMDWWERLKTARNFYRDRPEWIDCEGVDLAQRAYGATHVVLGPEQIGLDCPQLEVLFADDEYAVYRIRPAEVPPR